MLTESIFNASFGIFMPKWSGTIYELLSAPVSTLETLVGYVGAAASKSCIVALVIFATAHLFVDVQVAHPFWALCYLLLVAVTFCLFGFILGLWAKGFEQLQVIPLLVVTPLTFLGGAFYSIDMLPGIWRTISLFNPIVYLISGFRWTFFGVGDVPVAASLGATFGFLCICVTVIAVIFRTGWRLKK
jgi:ABC-2 type transport system permease protein